MGEMTALDARYHKQCLTALANTNTNPKSEFNIEEAIEQGGIIMGELTRLALAISQLASG